MLCDYHVHTYYSDDSEYPMEEVVKDAIDMQMKEICFTDHVDYGIKQDPMEIPVNEREGKCLNVDYPTYFAELERMQQKYGAQLVIKKGMEFGVQIHTIPQFEKLFDSYEFDFIILSCHQVEDKEFWTQDFQKGRSQKEYNERYYQEILHVIRSYNNYSVLGHLDLINRYDEAGVYPFEKVKPIITEILKQVIADGKGIELNTSCCRYGLSDLTPAREILKLYLELGGTILTLGSDSHAPAHLGAYIEQTMELLKEIGFTTYCTFEKMNPIFHTL